MAPTGNLNLDDILDGKRKGFIYRATSPDLAKRFLKKHSHNNRVTKCVTVIEIPESTALRIEPDLAEHTVINGNYFDN
jgi:(2Fe-2S) ferredoxin